MEGHGKGKMKLYTIYCTFRKASYAMFVFFYLATSENQLNLNVDRVKPEGIVSTMRYSCFVTWAHTSQGEYEHAEPLFRRAMEVTEDTLGKDHPQYSVRLSNLSGVLREQVRASVCSCTLGSYLAGIDVLAPCCSFWAVMGCQTDSPRHRDSSLLCPVFFS